jgi:L-ribulokinase
VTRRSLSFVRSEQGPALGSALHAAVAAGAYPDVPAAASVMGSKRDAVVVPDPVSASIYDQLYADYVLLHDYFGRGANEVMHRLRALRDRGQRDRAHGDRAPLPQQREEAEAWQSTS